MKKSIVALLVVLALVVLVSPGLVGRLAEQSMDEQVNWAADQGGDLVVTSEQFDRGWFSSAGQHRVELRNGDALEALRALGGDAGGDEVPVLLINTRLDHGLIPLTSLGREEGSLAPGLGSAVSTLALEFPDGETVDLPGKIFTKIGLSGDLVSRYALDAGSYTDGENTADWGDSEFNFTMGATSHEMTYDGSIGPLTLDDGGGGMTLDSLNIVGYTTPTDIGINVGDFAMEMGGLSFSSMGMAVGGIDSMVMEASSALVDDKVDLTLSMNMAMAPVGGLGETTMTYQGNATGIDAAALIGLQRTLQAANAAPDPEMLFPLVENDLKSLFAAGMEINFDQLDMSLPMGEVRSKMHLAVAPDDAASFEWTSLLLNTEGTLDVSITEPLVDMMLAMSPEAGAIVGMGYLRKNGDVYEMAAEMKKGLLTVNGAPIPIPLGGY